jgi:hypothetical protein
MTRLLRFLSDIGFLMLVQRSTPARRGNWSRECAEAPLTPRAHVLTAESIRRRATALPRTTRPG